MIAKTKIGAAWYYDWNSIHAPLTDVYPCATEILLDQYEGKMDMKEDGTHLFISRKTLIPFLRWVGERGTTEAERFLYDIEVSILKDVKQVRAMSRKHRWTVAYRQKYNCNICKALLHPKAFDVDHIVELARGGTDTLDNLQALCVQCHAIKTRS